MERGCVEDQPQLVNTPEFLKLLRLVENDIALRVFKTRSKVNSTGSESPLAVAVVRRSSAPTVRRQFAS